VSARRVDSEALLVRSVAYGESDLVVTLITRTDGKLSAIVRGGRKGSRRLGGALEPFHTMHVALDDRGGDLTALREAALVRVRSGLVGRLEAALAGGAALRWARHIFPARTPEPEGWEVLVALLDALDAGAPEELELAAAGLGLLSAVGYALDFAQCVRCGKPCPPDRPSAIDAGRGGLVCQACGGARRLVTPALRAAGRALAAGERPAAGLARGVAEELLAIVEDAMAAHTDYGG